VHTHPTARCLRCFFISYQVLPLKLLISRSLPWHKRVEWVIAFDVVMLLCGGAVSWMPLGSWQSVVALGSSCIAFVFVLRGLDGFLLHTQTCCAWLLDGTNPERRSSFQAQQVTRALRDNPRFLEQQTQNIWILRAVRVWVAATWSIFPCVWLLATTHLISHWTEEALFFIGDLTAKVLLCAALQTLNLGALSQSTEIHSLVEEGRNADATAVVRRLEQRVGVMELDASQKDAFLRYVFHEVRGGGGHSLVARFPLPPHIFPLRSRGLPWCT
jgi:hypothetical protein